MSVTFDHLPHDILIKISAKTDSITFGNFAQVNKNTYEAASEFAKIFFDYYAPFLKSDTEYLLAASVPKEECSFIQKFQLMHQRTFKISRELVVRIGKALELIDSSTVSNLQPTIPIKDLLINTRSQLLTILKYKEKSVSSLSRFSRVNLSLCNALIDNTNDCFQNYQRPAVNLLSRLTRLSSNNIVRYLLIACLIAVLIAALLVIFI